MALLHARDLKITWLHRKSFVDDATVLALNVKCLRVMNRAYVISMFVAFTSSYCMFLGPVCFSSLFAWQWLGECTPS